MGPFTFVNLVPYLKNRNNDPSAVHLKGWTNQTVFIQTNTHTPSQAVGSINKWTSSQKFSIGSPGPGHLSRVLVKLYRFLAREPTLSSAKLCWRGCSWLAPTSRSFPFLSWMVGKIKLPGWEDKTAVVMGVTLHDACVQELPPNWWCTPPHTAGVHCMGTITARAAFPRPEVRSLVLPIWLWTPSRAVALSCPLLLAKVARCLVVQCLRMPHSPAHPTCTPILKVWASEAAPPAATAKKTLLCPKGDFGCWKNRI